MTNYISASAVIIRVFGKGILSSLELNNTTAILEQFRTCRKVLRAYYYRICYLFSGHLGIRVRLKTTGDRRRHRRQSPSRRHRKKNCRLAAAARKKCILPMSANGTDVPFNITLLRFYIISRYKPVRNTPNTNCRVLHSTLDFQQLWTAMYNCYRLEM